MWPTTPEIVLLVVLSLMIFGLGRLSSIGDFVWRVRRGLTNSGDDGSSDLNG